MNREIDCSCRDVTCNVSTHMERLYRENVHKSIWIAILVFIPTKSTFYIRKVFDFVALIAAFSQLIF
ncbi:MAG: hypothetical protein CLLPBCKN_008392 [Chroococcidiopsis cubana SAG 39.79]|jgi:hypothetical protein|nr:hypothetical protein [Chroococcidiopsis cubana SAG 39.79]